jgi:pyruvate dehydrogenase E1 component alpha subunit
MLLIRRVEEESARGYAEGKIGGFLHLYIGQEAVGVGAIASLQPDDYVMTTYRDHGIALAKGMSARALLAELFGKVRAPHARRLRHRRRAYPRRGRGGVREQVSG